MAATNPQIFFHEAFEFVRKEITDREVQYGASKRAGFHSKAKHASFIHGKTGWASVTSNGKKLDNSKANQFENYYSEQSNGNYVPRPGLIDVNVRHDGDYGTLQRATVNFKVFTIGQLESLECDFLSVGQEVEVEYGWSVGGRTDGDAKANKGKFIGVINNFGYTLNKEGGFDCMFDAVGEGYFTLGVDPTPMGADAEAATSTDESEVPEAPFTGIINLIRSEIKDDTYTNHGDTNGNTAAFELSLIVTGADVENFDGSVSVQKMRYYTTLEYLVTKINEEISKDVTTKNKFICDAETTKGFSDVLIKSPATQHIVYPSKKQGNYEDDAIKDILRTLSPDVQDKLQALSTEALAGEKLADKSKVKLDFSLGDQLNFDIGDTVDLSKILINLDTLQLLQANLAFDDTMETTIKNYLTKIFDLIRKCSGDVYDLTIVPDSENPNNLLIVNGRYTETVTDDKWVVFKPFGPQSVVRDISLSAEVPDSLSTVAYVATRGGDGNTNEYPEHVAKMLTNKCNEGNKEATSADISNAPAGTNSNGLGDSSTSTSTDAPTGKQASDIQAANEEKDRKTTKLASLYLPVILSYFVGPRQEIEYDFKSVELLFNKVQLNGLTGYKALVNRSVDGKTKWNKNMPIPLKFSVTLDGINGFKFGDVVTTNYLPSKYKSKDSSTGFKAAFTVLKVNHQISNNDWTTTLETVCRLV